MSPRRVCAGLLAVLALSISLAAAAPGRPRLVVVIVIDQLRPDYLTRFEDLYVPARSGGKPGGFRYLMQEGAWFLDARHDHFPLFTAVGHSVILTGAPPYKSGIVGNEVYDRGLGRRRRCVEDPNVPLVGASPEKRGISPASLLVSTVGDEMKMATGGRSRVWGLATKERCAVLLAGHLADGALWYDEETGGWVTSRAYAKDGVLPGWVAEWNARKKVDAFFGRTWMPSIPESALARLWNPGNEEAKDYYGLGTKSPHKVDGGLAQPGRSFYKAFNATPFAITYLFETARRLVERQDLGKDDVPDLLAISVASDDYVGHYLGSESPELLDAIVRTDREIAAFLGDLDRMVPGGLAGVTIAVTSDHGVAPVVPAAKRAGLPAGVYDLKALREAADRALDSALGPDEWIADLVEANLYLDPRAVQRRNTPRPEAERIAAEAIGRVDGIYAAYTRSAILSGSLPPTEIAQRVARSFHPAVSGDVVVVPSSHWVIEDASVAADHGSPYAYDTSAPLILAGAGIRAGRHLDRVSTLDIAPTLAVILGILPPSGSEGRVLSPALALP